VLFSIKTIDKLQKYSNIKYNILSPEHLRIIEQSTALTHKASATLGCVNWSYVDTAL